MPVLQTERESGSSEGCGSLPIGTGTRKRRKYERDVPKSRLTGVDTFRERSYDERRGGGKLGEVSFVVIRM